MPALYSDLRLQAITVYCVGCYTFRRSKIQTCFTHEIYLHALQEKMHMILLQEESVLNSAYTLMGKRLLAFFWWFSSKIHFSKVLDKRSRNTKLITNKWVLLLSTQIFFTVYKLLGRWKLSWSLKIPHEIAQKITRY